MRNKIACLLIIMSPGFAYSQTYISADSANMRIMNGGDCDDRTFTRIETLPSLKIPKQDFIDSISTYLKSYGSSIEDGTITLLFIVDCHSKISNIQRMSGRISDIAPLKNAVLESSSFWLPGRQNNYIASSFVRLEMKFKNNHVDDIKISQ